MPNRLLAPLWLCTLAVPATAGEIRGRVLVDDKPAPGVAVSVRAFEDGLAEARREARREDPPSPLAEATCRADGSFVLELKAAPGAPVRLAFSGGPAVPSVLPRLLDASGEDVGDVRLARAQPLAGRVLDERGGPVVGATVTLWPGAARRFPAEASGDTPAQHLTTKADGTFRFETAAEQGNRLRVEAPAMATVERTQVPSGALLRPVVLPIGLVLRGTVRASDKRTPAAGALVRFEGRTTTRWFETRGDGSFLIEGVPREAGSLVADAGDRGRGVVPVAAGASEPQLVVLAPVAVVAGRVVDADSARPLPGVRLVARGEGGTFLGRSGSDGRYTIPGLAPQRYRLEADDERFVPWSRSITVAAGGSETQDVPLVRAATLVGRVLDEEGAPIAGAAVQVTRGAESPFRAFVRSVQEEGVVRSGKDGVFRAARLAPGDNQRLDVRHDDYEERSIGGLSLAPGAVRSGLVVVLRHGLGVRGIVKDEDDHPLAGAKVTLSRARSFRAGRGGMQVTMVGLAGQVQRETGADGRFAFQGLKAGDYTITARRPGFAGASVDPVKVAEGRGAEPVELTLRPGTTISGSLHDRSGTGAAGWYVSARPAGEGGGPPLGPGAIRTEEPTGADGIFVLEGLARGETYDLQVMGPSGLGPRRAGVEAPAEGIDFTVTGTGQIRGRVVDADSGRAIPDFEVRYQPDAQGGMRFVMRMGPGRGRGAFERQPFHAEDGSFVLEDVPAGRFTVEAFADGYQSGSASGVTVGENEAAEGVEVRLSKGGVVSGRVLESRTGRAILDATVQATPSSGEPRMRFGFGGEAQEDSASTDADGHYEISGLAPGTWTLTASHPDWSEATTTVELKDAPATADIRLGRGGSVAGVVLAAGRPVAGAQVSLSSAGDTGFRGMGGGDQGTLTDGSGRFRFERLTPGRYSVVAALRDQSSSPAEAVVTGDDAQEVQLTLAEGALIRGAVSGLPDDQLASVSVSAQGPDYYASTRAGADGSFELSGVPEGTIALTARSGDFMTSSRSASSVVTIAAGQTEATAEIVFEAGFHVEGHVSRAGQGVPDAMVSAFPEGSRGRSSSGRTDESGAFALEGLEEGTYTFVASAQNSGPARKTVTLSGDTTVDLEIPPARIAGTVVEAETGRPIGDVAVRIEDSSPGMRFMTMATSDSAGRFTFEDLEPRVYRLSFQKPAFQVETREVTAAEDSDVRVELRRGEGIALEAHDGIFATPLHGLFVRVADATGAAVFAGSVSLDSDGRGEVPSLKPGSYALRAESSGYAPVSLPAVAVPSPTLMLALTPGGSVEIQVGPQTQALPQASALLIGADGQPYMPSAFSSDGKIRLSGPVRRLEHVTPGRYALQVEGGARRDVNVTEGGTSVVGLP
jgi:protocatechuate 3,4-dioxygenase beta subunit